MDVARNSLFVTGIVGDSSIDKSTEETILAHTQDAFGIPNQRISLLRLRSRRYMYFVDDEESLRGK